MTGGDDGGGHSGGGGMRGGCGGGFGHRSGCGIPSISQMSVKGSFCTTLIFSATGVAADEAKTMEAVCQAAGSLATWTRGRACANHSSHIEAARQCRQTVRQATPDCEWGAFRDVRLVLVASHWGSTQSRRRQFLVQPRRQRPNAANPDL